MLSSIKKLYIFAFVALLFLISPKVIFAEINVTFHLKIISAGINFDSLFYGINDKATERIDTALGEYELPPFAPPSGLYAVMIIRDSLPGDDGWIDHWSYKSYLPPAGNDSVMFLFQIFNQQSDMEIQWPDFPPEVKKAFLRDVYTQESINLDMLSTNSIFIENTFFKKFYIVIFYDTLSSAIEDETTVDGWAIEPNPAEDYIVLRFNSNFNYSIVNCLGEQVLNGIVGSSEKKIDISNLAPGVYFILSTSANGKAIKQKFIKY
jgi:hypothetical protein